ncbi:MAG: hypothetical protein CML60_00505 [Rhodobacteraceae bacterium]|nr:hypothetical protein [Paracoccaceae bacterium]MBT24871.1 hypothetical protein [Paracoccaceae bacterium]
MPTQPADHSTPSFVRLDAKQPPNAQQIVLVSGLDVPLIRLDLPAGLRGIAREQVARRQLSDRLGLDMSAVQMRPFAAANGADDWNRVLITDPAHLAQWKQTSARAVLPDYLSLPCAAQIWCLDTDETGSVLARLGPQDGFSARPAMLLSMLESALQETEEKPIAIHLLSPLADAEIWAREQGLPVTRTEKELAALDLPLPGVLTHNELSADLRADPMAARSRLAARVLPWRWPLLAGTLAAALFGTVQQLQTNKLTTDTARINAQTQAQVQTAFPNLGPLLDIRLQVTRALADLQSKARPETRKDPIELTRLVAQATHTFGTIPEQLSYTANDGIVLALRLPDFATIERLAEALRSAGLTAEVTDSRASTDTDGVRAEYRIQMQEARE